ncbi:hypothetical protein Q8P09_12310 [Psychrobacter faecalis]|uniref:Uncharacterized protein n=1 Tax=Psychrobacter faecalis TaxID=180588 RepID=A0ABT9HJB1_9GAMM|nr:hypothetical protein [Psychrobacter faecalis]MDP4545858.1 hypothetical protein [Psychrobacter faecalis]
MDIKYYRVELIDDATDKDTHMLVAATENPKTSLKFINGLRVFWVVDLSYEQYVEQSKGGAK